MVGCAQLSISMMDEELCGVSERLKQMNKRTFALLELLSRLTVPFLKTHITTIYHRVACVGLRWPEKIQHQNIFWLPTHETRVILKIEKRGSKSTMELRYVTEGRLVNVLLCFTTFSTFGEGEISFFLILNLIYINSFWAGNFNLLFAEKDAMMRCPLWRKRYKLKMTWNFWREK